MEKASIAEALRALASDSESRSKISRMRELYPDIEAAQKAGVTNSKIVETLNSQGLDVTLKTFETMLYRLRKELGKTRKTAQEVKSEIPPASAPAPEASAADTAQNSTRSISTPGDIKKALKGQDVNLDDYTE